MSTWMPSSPNMPVAMAVWVRVGWARLTRRVGVLLGAGTGTDDVDGLRLWVDGAGPGAWG